MTIEEEQINTNGVNLTGSDNYVLWSRSMRIGARQKQVKVRPGLLSSVVYASNASKVWEDLKERFNKVNGSRVLFLHREIHTLTQGTVTIADYFSKLRDLWDEFDVIMPCPVCACPESQRYLQHFKY
ncbi:hypothetical protein KY284_030054 [Solanum tuberosum]|nr:hypothetical protein KY284_030054 [Solanum tuberosum]